jgi:hypothetical protein
MLSNTKLTKDSLESSTIIDPIKLRIKSRCLTAPLKQPNGDEEFKYGLQFFNLEKSGIIKI